MDPLTLAPDSIDLRVFRAVPGNSIVLRPDAPGFTIVTATEDYCRTSGRSAAELAGKGMFEAFPAPPDDPGHNGTRQLRASLDTVLRERAPDRMPLVRYDIENADGSFDERWWSAVNTPVLDDAGDVRYIIHTAEEMTEKVRAEETANRIRDLEQSQQLFLQAPVAIGIVKGPDYIIELANDSLLEVWGRTAADVLGRPVFEALPDLQGQGYRELLDAVRVSGEPYYGYEYPLHITRNGQEELEYYDFVYKPYYEEAATGAAGVFTIGHNVTERVLARKRLEESEAEAVRTARRLEESEGRFRLLADASPILIWMLRPNGDYAYVNKTTLAFLGVAQEDIAREGWEPYQHPDDLAEARRVLGEAIAARKPYVLEHRLRHHDGGYRWVLSQATPALDSGGEVIAYVGSSIDIHEARKSRQQLETALEQVRLSKEAAELGTFDMDLKKGTMHWDARCRTLFGISHDGPVSYEHDFLHGLHPDDRDRITGVIDGLFNHSLPGGDYDVEYRTVGATDGVVRWVRAKGKVYFNAQDAPVRFIGSVLDITPQKTALQRIEQLVDERTRDLAAANEALTKSNRELKRSNTNLEEFAHAASHDLKEPVRKIHFFTNQLRDQLGNRLSESEHRSLTRIQGATQRMGSLIDDLLLYSHVSQRPLEREAVDLNTRLQQVLEDLDLEIEEKGATIRVGTLPVLPGYGRQLQQLFQNLVSNALKYSKAGVPPVIDVSASAAEQAGRRYQVVTVRDNGIGFAPEYADKIFQMFARLHGKAEYSGTGVGLSIVKKVVENHEGLIEANGTPGEGAEFRVWLPVG
ncbi:PAS domain S-box protein [Flaviaesturariibacter amylovorans]|uniref:histidine kinase n=1 Tax=Flaviaesturariibacter amylovorans TaxID=1084520 RepID=A0ABP8HNV4_9BACT